MSKKNDKKEKTETIDTSHPPKRNDSSDWIEFLKTLSPNSFVRLSQKEYDLKKVRKTLKRLQKKNLTKVEYAVGGKKGNRSIYIFQLGE